MSGTCIVIFQEYGIDRHDNSGGGYLSLHQYTAIYDRVLGIISIITATLPSASCFGHVLHIGRMLLNLELLR